MRRALEYMLWEMQSRAGLGPQDFRHLLVHCFDAGRRNISHGSHNAILSPASSRLKEHAPSGLGRGCGRISWQTYLCRDGRRDAVLRIL
jgi:hypothetical protein